MNKYSITSNEVKLFKHLPQLYGIQQSIPSPIQLHVSLTNRCNLNCVHCCFSGRDKETEQDYDYVIGVIASYLKLGIKSIEFTGGGEPTMYKRLNDVVDICYNNLAIGMNTNAIDINNIKNPEKFKWIRVALNVIDTDDNKLINKFINNVHKLKRSTQVTSCYIVPKEIGLKNLHRVIEVANILKIPTRIAPDCIQSKEDIKDYVRAIGEHVNYAENNKYCFCSEFNVYLDNRPDNKCYIHFIKPFLYTDGYIYACPSSELDIGNDRTMQKKFRICHGSDVGDVYRYNIMKPKVFDCGYCKYAKQNELLRYILTESTNNEFV